MLLHSYVSLKISTLVKRISLCRSYLFYLRQFYASIRWRYADILETSMLDHIKNPSNFKQFFFFLKGCKSVNINRVATYNYKRQNLFVCFGQKFECGNLTLLEFHFCDVEEKCKKINFTRTSILLLKIKIPHSLFKKKKKKITKNYYLSFCYSFFF